MRKKNVTFVVQIKEKIPVVIGSFKSSLLFKVDDVIALQPTQERSIFFRIVEISANSSEHVEIIVRYFGSRKVLQRASLFNASITPLDEVKLNYNGIVTSMLYSE